MFQWSVITNNWENRRFCGFQMYACVYTFVYVTVIHSKHYQQIVIVCSDTITFIFSIPHINYKLMHSLLENFEWSRWPLQSPHILSTMQKAEKKNTSNSLWMIGLCYGEACTEYVGSSFELLLTNTFIYDDALSKLYLNNLHV